MSTTKLAVSLLFVLTLVFIVGLSRYQLIISHKRLPPVFRPVSPAVALKLNHTIENNTATSAGNTMIPWYDRAGRLKFDAPVTFANPIWKQAHVSRSRATFGHFQFHHVIICWNLQVQTRPGITGVPAQLCPLGGRELCPASACTGVVGSQVQLPQRPGRNRVLCWSAERRQTTDDTGCRRGRISPI